MLVVEGDVNESVKTHNRLVAARFAVPSGHIRLHEFGLRYKKARSPNLYRGEIQTSYFEPAFRQDAGGWHPGSTPKVQDARSFGQQSSEFIEPRLVDGCVFRASRVGTAKVVPVCHRNCVVPRADEFSLSPSTFLITIHRFIIAHGAPDASVVFDPWVTPALLHPVDVDGPWNSATLPISIRLTSTSPPKLALDSLGNVIGGVRTPAVDVPVSTLTGGALPGTSVICSLFGSTTPCSSSELTALYGSKASYLEQYNCGRTHPAC
jgi:Alpha/beta hydrolase domain